MKLLLIFASLTFLSYAADDFINIPIQKLEEDLINFEYLNYGVDKLLEKMHQNGDAPNNPFDVTRLYQASQKPLGSREEFQFHLKLDDHKGTKIETTFTVEVQDKMPDKLLSYKYNVRTEGTADIGEDLLVQPDHFQDPMIQEVITYGTEEVLQDGYKSGKIPQNQSYYVSKINKIVQEPSNKKNNYKVDLTMENEQGNIEIDMSFTVLKDENSGNFKLMAFNYNIYTYSS